MLNYTFVICIIQHAEDLPLENTEDAIKIGNPEKLATYGTPDEDKQNKNTTQY